MPTKTVQGVFGSSLETTELKKRVESLEKQNKELMRWLTHVGLIVIHQDGSIDKGSIDLDCLIDPDVVTDLQSDVKDLTSKVDDLKSTVVYLDGYDDSELIKRIEKLEAK